MDDWLKIFRWANQRLQQRSVEHVFVKLLRDPFRPTDIDLLIPDPHEQERAMEALGGREIFVRGGLLEGPRRMILQLRNLDIDIDIYPEACWGGLKVADGTEIVGRRHLKNVLGENAYLPSPADDFYLIATHAYSHLNIRRAEIKNCRAIASDASFSWERVWEMASRFGMIGPVKIFSEAVDNGRVGKIPSWKILRFFHTHKIIENVERRELISDFLWHLVRPITKSLGVR